MIIISMTKLLTWLKKFSDTNCDNISQSELSMDDERKALSDFAEKLAWPSNVPLSW